jgi:hypothetical protein
VLFDLMPMGTGSLGVASTLASNPLLAISFGTVVFTTSTLERIASLDETSLVSRPSSEQDRNRTWHGGFPVGPGRSWWSGCSATQIETRQLIISRKSTQVDCCRSTQSRPQNRLELRHSRGQCRVQSFRFRSPGGKLPRLLLTLCRLLRRNSRTLQTLFLPGLLTSPPLRVFTSLRTSQRPPLTL